MFEHIYDPLTLLAEHSIALLHMCTPLLKQRAELFLDCLHDHLVMFSKRICLFFHEVERRQKGVERHMPLQTFHVSLYEVYR